MASTVETATFKHDALPDASTYIRLLEVVSVDPTPDVSVHCRLTTWPKASAPAYTAISYTWGDPRQVTVILVNGKGMTVRRNCEDVLRQQCWAKGGHFWIDAICINQADNDEKSFQVAKMGEVYRNARQTLACLGPHADDSEFLFETLHRQRCRYMQHDGYLSDIIDLTDYLSRRLIDNSILVRLEKALNLFLKRSYFQRVWIYQELFLGNDTQFCCAHENIELTLLWALYLAIRKWMLSADEPGNLPLSIPVRQSLYYLDNDKLLLRAVAMGKERLELSSMISAVRELQCEDPKDRMFGTLAIVDWEGGTPIRPDYGMDAFDLAVKILKRLDNPRNFLMRILKDTINIACLVGLHCKPSRRLADEMLARRSRKHTGSFVGAGITGQAIDLEATTFWGYRIYSDDAGWHMLSGASKGLVDGGSVLRDESSTDPTTHNRSFTLQKWSKGTLWDVDETSILLPPVARTQDWLLIPDLTIIPYSQTPAALIARDGSDGHPQIVGKALFDVSGDWPWKALQRKGSEFGVYLDYEDAIVLAQSCNWNASGKPFSSNEHEPHKLQVDNYFQTRLCSERSGTYAKRRLGAP